MIQAKYRRVYVNIDVRFGFGCRKHLFAPVRTDGHKYEIDKVSGGVRMARIIENGRTHQILSFIDDFINKHGYSPTIREIGQAVGLRSNSTTAGYLDRMQKADLISSRPSSARSIRIVRKVETDDTLCESTLRCTFRLPAGTHPMSVIAMVSTDGSTSLHPVQAEKIEIIR